jgi:hypothetical protein
MIPLLLKLHIVEDGRKKINLWLPLFLIWIILLAILIVMLPFILIAAFGFWIFRNDTRILSVIPIFFSILCALSGLVVLIEEKNRKVFLAIP